MEELEGLVEDMGELRSEIEFAVGVVRMLPKLLDMPVWCRERACWVEIMVRREMVREEMEVLGRGWEELRGEMEQLRVWLEWWERWVGAPRVAD